MGGAGEVFVFLLFKGWFVVLVERCCAVVVVDSFFFLELLLLHPPFASSGSVNGRRRSRSFLLCIGFLGYYCCKVSEKICHACKGWSRYL